MRRGLLLAVALMVVGAGAHGQEAPPSAAAAGSDTVRTNLWIAEALMGEAVAATMPALPPAPAVVRLVPKVTDASTEILTTVISRRLRLAGYDLRLPLAASDTTVVSADADCEFRYEVVELTLAYPETGRRFGIWREWVGREMAFTGLFTVVETPLDRVLFNDRVRRTYRDRVPNDEFAGCESKAYAFTSAATREGGWTRRVEEIVVLGALAGLVAVYFQNTD